MPEEIFDKVIALDPSIFEYELSQLRPNTSYIISIKLYNEAGAFEQRIRKTTLKQRNGTLTCFQSKSSVFFFPLH